jgi:hypothetical protein
MTEEKLYSTRKAYERLNELTGGAPPSIATLNKLAVIGGGPSFRKFGRQRIYADEDLAAWLHSRMTAKVNSTAELPPSGIKGRGRPRKDAKQAAESGAD